VQSVVKLGYAEPRNLTKAQGLGLRVGLRLRRVSHAALLDYSFAPPYRSVTTAVAFVLRVMSSFVERWRQPVLGRHASFTSEHGHPALNLHAKVSFWWLIRPKARDESKN
jgi:hypothetical protein